MAVMDGLSVRADPRFPPPLPLEPPTHTSWRQWGTANFGANGAQEIFFWPLVKESENWFHPMCVYPKCSKLNGDFKYFICPFLGTPLDWGDVATHTQLLANNGMGTVDQAEVVDVAMRLTLLAGCLC